MSDTPSLSATLRANALDLIDKHAAALMCEAADRVDEAIALNERAEQALRRPRGPHEGVPLNPAEAPMFRLAAKALAKDGLTLEDIEAEHMCFRAGTFGFDAVAAMVNVARTVCGGRSQCVPELARRFGSLFEPIVVDEPHEDEGLPSCSWHAFLKAFVACLPDRVEFVSIAQGVHPGWGYQVLATLRDIDEDSQQDIAVTWNETMEGGSVLTLVSGADVSRRRTDGLKVAMEQVAAWLR